MSFIDGGEKSDRKGLLDFATDVYSEDSNDDLLIDTQPRSSNSNLGAGTGSSSSGSGYNSNNNNNNNNGNSSTSNPSTSSGEGRKLSFYHSDDVSVDTFSDDLTDIANARRTSNNLGHTPDISKTLQRAKEREEETLENEKGINEELANEKLRYDDFTTIDWMRDHARETQRQRTLRRERLPGWKGKIQSGIDAGQGWMVVFVIGIIAGFVAGCIDVAAEWLSDIKEGVCPDAFYLNKAFCCWSSSEENCTSWKKWSEFGDGYSGSSAYAVNYFIYVTFAVVFATLSAILAKNLAPYASGSGIPQVKTILGGFIIRKFLGFWTLVTKAVGLVLSVSSGMSLGKEGPFVHIVCCIGNICCRMFEKYRNNEAKKREVLSASAAAGVSVAFGAPVGGVLFSLEEVSYYFPHKTMWRSFFCALVAATTLRYMNPFLTGRISLFYVEYDDPWHMMEIIPFVLLGVFGGAFGAAFIRINGRWCEFRKSTRLSQYPVTEVAAIALITAAINYLNPFQRVASGSLMRDLFSECTADDTRDICDNDNIGKVVGLLFLAACFRMFITVFTFGLKLPSGIFIPSMAIGACMGRIVGIAMQRFVINNPTLGIVEISCGTKVEECIQPGLYAMVGAAAVLAGVTRMTVSLVVIMFELTGGLSYILPFMSAMMVSKWVGDAISHEGLYDRHIRLNGYPFLDNREEFRQTTLACDVMYPQRGDAPICVLPVFGNTVGQLETLLEETHYKGFPVVMSSETMQIAGYVSRSELLIALEKAQKHNHDINKSTPCTFTQRTHNNGALNLRHVLDASPIQIAEHTQTEMVLELFRKLGLRYSLVTRNGQLIGIITKKDLLKHMAILNHRDPNDVLYS